MRREVTLCTKLSFEWQVSQQQTQKVPEFTSRRKKDFFFLLCYNVLEMIYYLHSCYGLPSVLPSELVWSPNLLLQNFVTLSAVQGQNRRRALVPKALIIMKMKSLLEDSKPQQHKFIVLQTQSHFPPLKSSEHFSFPPLPPFLSADKCISENSYLCPEFKDLQLCYFMWNNQRACF